MSIPGFHPRAFVAGSSIGRGRTRAADIRKIRNTLDELGYLSSPPKARLAYTPAIADGIEQAQRDFELKPDGIIDPDGPTEQTLNLALIAKRAGGSDAVASVRDDIIRHNRRGLRLMRDSVNPGAFGVWRDKNGKRVEELKELSLSPSSAKESSNGLLSFPSSKGSEWSNPENLSEQKTTSGISDSKNASREALASGQLSNESRNPKLSQTAFLDLAGSTPVKSGPDQRMATYRQFAKIHRSLGNNEAGEMLDHYLDGSGAPIWFTPKQALSFGPIRDHQKIVQGHFENLEFVGKTKGDPKFNERMTGLRDGQTIKEVKQNEASFDNKDFRKEILGGNINFPLAFGKTSIKSTAAFRATRQGNLVHIEGTVTHLWHDTYDFEKGGSGGHGALELEKTHGAKPFDFGSSWKQTFKGTVKLDNGALSDPKITWTDKATERAP